MDNSYLIGKIDKALIAGDKVFVLCKESGEILCYNRQGEFCFCISDKGNGPNEYNHIQNFFLDRFNKRIKLLDLGGKQLEYSFEGKLLAVHSQRENAPFNMIMDGIQLDRSRVAYSGLGPDFNISVCTESTAENKYYIPYNEVRDLGLTFKAFSQCGASVLYCHGVDDTIYRVQFDGVRGAYYVDFLKNSIKPQLYFTNPGAVQEQYEHQVVATKLDELNETDEQICCSYWVLDPANEDPTAMMQYFVYDKKQKKTCNFKSGASLFPVRDVVDEHYFASLVPPVELLSSSTKIHPKIQEYLKSNAITSNHNPLLVVWEMGE